MQPKQIRRDFFFPADFLSLLFTPFQILLTFNTYSTAGFLLPDLSYLIQL